MLKGQIRRKVFAAGLALTMVFGGSSVLPFSQMFSDSIVCASADEITYTASFSCGSKSYNYTKPTGSNYTFLLSDVLTALDIEGEVTNVTVTENNSLFVEKKNGVWYLTMSNIWFSGKLTVTLGDTVKEITASVSQDRIPIAFVGWLIFNADGGTGTLTTEYNGTTYTNRMYCITGFHYTFPDCPYVRDGYEFAGWDINGVTYQPGDNYIHNATTTAKALWRENESGTIINQSDLASLSVADDLQHGTFDLPDEVRVGQKVHLVPAPDEGYEIYSVSVNGNTISSEKYQYYYTMTDTPAVVSGEFKKALAGGTENSPALLNDNEVYFLTGGWYKVSGNITFNHEIIFTDDVHIVLEDGCQMIVIPNSTAHSITAIRGKNDSDLYIHGGSTGKLIVQYVNNLTSSIATHDFYVLGGDVSVIGVNSDNAVYATGDVYISGGNISAPYDKISAHEGNVYVSGGTVTGTLTTLNYNTVYVSGGKISGTLKSRYVNITGGQVDAAINCEYGLVLGCNSADDYININSIGFSDTRAVTNIAPGVILKDKEGNEYQDSLTLDEAKALNGKKLIYSRENNVDFNVNVQAAYFGTITADKVTAQYGDKVSLTVTPKTGFNIKSVKYNDTEIIPDSEGNYSFNMPRGDAKVTAEFEKQKFTVTWKNWDGTVLETDEAVEYGSAPFYDGEEPVKAGAVFTGWDNEFSAVTGNVSYTAQFSQTVNKYTVTWKNGDTVLETDENVEYGTTPEYNGETPTKTGEDNEVFVFNGWDSEPAAVTGDMTYTAQFIKYTKVSATLATYTSAGNSEYYTCEDGKYYVLVNGEYQEIAENSWIIPQLTLVHHEAVAPTCTANGNIEYWYDEANNKYFSDANGENEITQADTVKAATNHDWNAPTYSWTAVDSGYKCTATRTCKNNASHEETEEAVVTYAEITAPTAGAKGLGRYTATFTNSAFAVQTNDVEVEMLTPEYADATYTWADDNSFVTAEKKCLNGGADITETVNTTSQITKPATCKAMGETTYYAVFTNGAFAKQEKTVANIAATDHSYTESSPIWSWVKNGDSYDVSVKFKCSICGDIEECDEEPELSYVDEDGYRTYTASVEFEGDTYTMSQRVKLSYNVTVNGVTTQYAYDEIAEAKITTIDEGKFFDGWYEGDKKVSSLMTYTFTVRNDVTLEARFVDSAVQAEPILNFSVSEREVLANGKNKVSFTVEWELPDDCTLVQAAIIRSYTNTDPKYNSSDATVKVSTLRDLSGSYKYNLTLGTASASKTIYARGYIIYLDKNGTSHQMYTDVIVSNSIS